MIVWNSQTTLPREPQPNPEFPGEFLYRNDDVTEKPPEFDVDTQLCQWDGSEWTITTKPKTEWMNGAEVPINEDIPQTLTALEQLRGIRQGLLLDMELYGKGLQDRPFTQAELDYRQELRDLPENSTPSVDENGELTGVTWPTPPE